MKKKSRYLVFFLVSTIIFLVGLISISASIPNDACFMPFHSENCNDAFNGSCTQSGACQANGSIVATICGIRCMSYVFDAEGKCVRDIDYVDCGQMRK